MMSMNAVCGNQTKLNWNEITNNTRSYSTDTENAENTWTIKVQPVDYAGNKAGITTATFSVDNGIPKLTSITTSKTSGIYKIGDKIDVKLVFSKKVKNTAAAELNIVT